MSRAIVRNELKFSTAYEASWLTKQVLQLPQESLSSLRIDALSLLGFTDERNNGNGNQDRIAVAYSSSEDLTKSWFLAVVCDGVGGSERGELAASSAIGKMIQGAKSNRQTTSSVGTLRYLLQEAHTYVGSVLNGKSSTTAVAYYVQGREAAIGWIGDSRAYKISGANATLLTVDDTLAGAIARVPSTAHLEINEEFANRLAQAIGGDTPVVANVAPWSERSDGTCLLCTDGVWKPLEGCLQKIIEFSGDGPEQLRRLLKVSEWLGGEDNASAVMVPSLGSIVDFLGKKENRTPDNSVAFYLPGNLQTFLVCEAPTQIEQIDAEYLRQDSSENNRQVATSNPVKARKAKARSTKPRTKSAKKQAITQMVISEEPLDEKSAESTSSIHKDGSKA